MEQTDRAPGTSIGAYITKHIREYGLLFALIAIMAFFQVVTGGVLLLAPALGVLGLRRRKA